MGEESLVILICAIFGSRCMLQANIFFVIVARVRQIWEAFVAFDLDKNKFVGAAEIRHVLVNIGEQVTHWQVYIS